MSRVLTPQNEVDCNILHGWKSLHENICRVLSKEVPYIEECDEKTELCAFEIGLLCKAICCSICDGLSAC